ncbi:MAG TPA: pilus assembly protein PilM [Candidatus Paceibacterota bacterium]|nr:pilus assembly protein PilM [Candidatus Paceibacterota bacterium]HPT17966.1 pilus assembly protein PilM [Candidatus Paceibacterota bacterium]
MFKNFFHLFFPTPKLLTVPSFGLDISDESIKFIELIQTNHGIKLGKHGERKIPAGTIESGKIKDLRKMEEILSSLRKEDKIKSVRVSLPEEQVYLFELRLEKAGLLNIRDSIELSLEEYIPISAQDAIFDYEILSEDEKGFDLQVSAIPKNIVEGYLSVFKNSMINVRSFELEAQAIARAVIKKEDKETYMIVDFGEKRAGIFIVSRGIVMFTSTLDVGGSLLTKMIQKNFKVTFEEAEKMKKKYGLERNTENKEMFSVLLNSISILRDEVVKHFVYWHTHKEGGKDRPPIKKIIMCGGDSNLIGLSDYFAVSTKNTIEIANVWVNINNNNKYIPEIKFDQSLTYAAAIGLALGNFEHD